MKKIINLVLIGILVIGLTGCAGKEKKQEELVVKFKDSIEGKANITKSGKNRIIKVDFDRRKEKEKVKVSVKYYKDKKIIYSYNIDYIFPDKKSECILELPIVKEYSVLKDGVSKEVIENKEYTDEYVDKIKVDYDYIKLTVEK